MGTTIKTLVTEIHVTFSTGMEHQLKKSGELEGAHMITQECIVDDATGEIQGLTRNPKNGQAQPLDPEKVQSILGERFVVFDQQLAESRKKFDSDLSDATKKYNDHIASIKEQLQAIFADHKVAAEKISQALAEHNDLTLKVSAAMGVVSS